MEEKKICFWKHQEYAFFAHSVFECSMRIVKSRNKLYSWCFFRECNPSISTIRNYKSLFYFLKQQWSRCPLFYKDANSFWKEKMILLPFLNIKRGDSKLQIILSISIEICWTFKQFVSLKKKNGSKTCIDCFSFGLSFGIGKISGQ